MPLRVTWKSCGTQDDLNETNNWLEQHRDSIIQISPPNPNSTDIMVVYDYNTDNPLAEQRIIRRIRASTT